MQGTWKTKKRHIQKDKFDQIVKTIKYLNPIKFKKELSVDFLEDYKLKQSKCPNNLRKKIYKKIVSSRNRRIKRDWIKNEFWEKEIPTHKLSKSILWEIV
ncbi:hypothetical protein [Aliarcobacter butzleri]|uniref:hypothetical protein n=1 Tax=Aliarcobacter butzleri TaxID=28197 RepID=UPI003B221A79